MKINKLEAHDRLNHLKEDQSANIFQGAEDCLKINPLSLAIQEKCPYVYLFAHPRTADDGVTKRMFWQPRISKPKPQTNSYLFRATSKTDIIEVCWLIPPREMWPQYNIGKVTQSDLVNWSVNQFQHHREDLERVHEDDLPEERGSLILQSIINEHRDVLRHGREN